MKYRNCECMAIYNTINLKMELFRRCIIETLDQNALSLKCSNL